MLGSRWLVRLVRSGRDLNGCLWRPEVLEANVEKFEGARVMWGHKLESERSRSDGRAGVISQVRFLGGENGKASELRAVLTAETFELRGVLLSLLEAGRLDRLGLSVFPLCGWTQETPDALATVPLESLIAAGLVADRVACFRREDESPIVPAKVIRVLSVDLVERPAAGGGFISCLD
jgi:hypothetical protein